jgi:hypothetical protein
LGSRIQVFVPCPQHRQIEPGQSNPNAVVLFDGVTTGAGNLYSIDMPAHAGVPSDPHLPSRRGMEQVPLDLKMDQMEALG